MTLKEWNNLKQGSYIATTTGRPRKILKIYFGCCVELTAAKGYGTVIYSIENRKLFRLIKK